MPTLGLKSKAARRIQSDFSDDQEGALINVEGDEKSGKNHFAFTAPKPLVCIAGDRDCRPVAKKHPGVNVVQFNYELPVSGQTPSLNEVARIVRPVWREVEDLFYDCLRSTSVKSIVIDTGTWAWTTIRLAKFGKLTQVPPILHTQVNALFERMLLSSQGTGKHVIWIHRIEDEWKNVKKKGKTVGEKTGRRVRSGFKHVGFDVEANIRVHRDVADFSAEVVDNGFDASCNGMTFKKKMCDYPSVMSVLTSTDRDQWS